MHPLLPKTMGKVYPPQYYLLSANTSFSNS